MDQSSFDRLARLLGGATSRRAGLRAIVLAAFSAPAATAAAADPGARQRNRGEDDASPARRDPSPSGPCGTNRCRRNKDCCTGICNTRRSDRNRDGSGRCRCIERGRACAEDRNCCGSLGCHAGKCLAAPPAPTPPSGCASDADCAATPKKPVCDQGSRACVQCTADANCASQAVRKTCNTESNACVQCTGDANCASESVRKVCNPDSNACVQCISDAGCAAQTTRQVCNTSDSTCVECVIDTDCSGATPVCNTSAFVCVECFVDGDCSGSTPVCKSEGYTCVECVNDGDCSGATPACDTVDNICESCPTPTTANLVTGSPLHTPAGIAIDPSSSTKQVWVANFAYNSAANDTKLGYMKFDGTGLTMGASLGKGIQGIALSSDKIPFGAANDSNAGNIYSWDPTTLAPSATPVCTSTDANFKSAYGVYVDGDSTSGTIWITSAANAAAVWKFKIGTDTAPVQVWQTLGSTGRAIVKGPGGLLYGALEGSNLVVALDPAVAASGSLPSTTTVANLSVPKPFGLIFDGDTMYVNNSQDSKIYRYNVTLDNANVPSISLVCEYLYSVAGTFFIGPDPDGNILSPFWGATRPQDGVVKITI